MNYRTLTYILLMILLPIFAVSSFAQNEPAQAVTDSTSAEGENADNDSLMYSHPTYIYDTLGKKDPFQSLVPEEGDEENIIKELFSYEEATILGIVTSDTGSYALVTDVNGASYVLRIGDSVLGGRVEQITDDAVVLDIVKYARAMKIIMRLESSKYTVYEEIDGESVIRRPGINITYGQDQVGTDELSFDDITMVPPDSPLLDTLDIGTRKKLLFDKVVYPSIDTKLIEEEWFGEKDESDPQAEDDPAENQTDLSGIIPLLTPNNKSWITLPFAFEWLNPEKLECVYTVIIYDDSELNNPVYIEHDIETTTYLLGDDAGLPPNRDLFWEVIAHKSSGNERINRQTVMSFKIKGQ
ncbi:hypothetical protein ACFL6P_07875 [Candidatus Latescibacterota bacterium]